MHNSLINLLHLCGDIAANFSQTIRNVSMFLWALRHRCLEIIDKKSFVKGYQCSSELHFISTMDMHCEITGSHDCVNALPSSTSFLQQQRLSELRHKLLCQCSSELHFISTEEITTYSFFLGVCQCSSELHFISTLEFIKGTETQHVVSMLFRAPLHFYSVTPSGSNSRQMCQCSSELHFISTVLQRTFCKRIRIVSMLFRAPLHFYPDLSETLDLQGFLRPFLQVFFRIF